MSFPPCRKFLDETLATVFLMLSYFTGAIAYKGAFFGPGVGPITQKRIDCTGSGDSLQDCLTNNQQSINCTHSRDAAVVCARTLSNTTRVNVE